MTNTQIILTILGLILDLIGVYMLFKYGLPPDINRTGATLIIDSTVDEEEVKKANRYERLSWIAFSFIVVGFVLQIISTILYKFHC